jgi:hypothetical protein
VGDGSGKCQAAQGFAQFVGRGDEGMVHCHAPSFCRFA